MSSYCEKCVSSKMFIANWKAFVSLGLKMGRNSWQRLLARILCKIKVFFCWWQNIMPYPCYCYRLFSKTEASLYPGKFFIPSLLGDMAQTIVQIPDLKTTKRTKNLNCVTHYLLQNKLDNLLFLQYKWGVNWLALWHSR